MPQPVVPCLTELWILSLPPQLQLAQLMLYLHSTCWHQAATLPNCILNQGSGYLSERNIQITWLGLLLVTSCQLSPSCFCAQNNSLGWTEQMPQQAIWFGSEDLRRQLLPACIISVYLTTNSPNQLLESLICTSRSGYDLAASGQLPELPVSSSCAACGSSCVQNCSHHCLL